MYGVLQPGSPIRLENQEKIEKCKGKLQKGGKTMQKPKGQEKYFEKKYDNKWKKGKKPQKA